MVQGFDVKALNLIGKLISKLERFHLENATPIHLDPYQLLEGSDQRFFRVRGIADFWKHGVQGGNFSQFMTDVVIASHNQSTVDLTMILLGQLQTLHIYISLGSEETTRTLLEGIFPGIILELVDTEELLPQLETHLNVNGVVTGIPSQKAGNAMSGDTLTGAAPSTSGGGVSSALDSSLYRGDGASLAPLERVIRGMYGAQWAYVVQAHPRPRVKVIEERMKTMDLLSQITNRSRVQWLETQQQSLQKTTNDSGGQTQSYGGDMINYRAQYLSRLLETQLNRLDQSIATGQWLVRAFFGASNSEDARRLGSLLLGALSGADSRPEPLRTILTQPVGSSLEGFTTFLTSAEIGTLTQLPREEVPGYAIHDYVYFDADFPHSNEAQLPIGNIQYNGKETSETYNISLDALTKHAVVIGVTGSGKTTTVMNMLDKVVDAGKPFLVIEPAKTEYRSLYSTISARAKLFVYTLGNETVAPFRLNPFEFETDDEPGTASLLTHIDFLKAVFNAAFPLYAPMPQVLETALHEIYEDRGWDLTSGLNMRLPDWGQRQRYPIFPTMTDLYNKVEAVTVRLGYDKEVESNVKAALKSRIGSLRIGSKGLMLDTVRGVPMEQLLSHPTILELENIGNDDEKTFIMGLFLARLYEFRRLQSATGKIKPGLQHLIVFEEAHRLLKNTTTQVDSEAANPRAQAIEVFTNMLSEVRAYGQGVLVAEQIPSKLAPDVLKNTNLKVVHRLIAQDDRLSIGQTMNLNDEQQNHLGVLQPGMAAVFAEGADHAYLVQLENYKRKLSPLTDKALRKISLQYASVQKFQAIPDLQQYGLPLAPTGGPDPFLYQAASKILDSPKSRWLWASIILRIITYPDNVPEILLRFSEQIEKDMAYIPAASYTTVFAMTIIRGCAELLQQRGAQFGWTYAEVEELRALLTHGLVTYTQVLLALSQQESKQEHQQRGEALRNADKQLDSFGGSYMQHMSREHGPFAGCQHCPARCLFRTDVATLLTNKNSKWVHEELTSARYKTSHERYDAVTDAAFRIAQSWLGVSTAEPATLMVATVGYCIYLHTIAQHDFNEYEQITLAEKAQSAFFAAQKDPHEDVEKRA